MHWTRILGIALLVGGVILFFIGLTATDTVGEQLHEAVTGRFTETTTWYLVGGAVAAVVGIFLTAFGARR